MTETNGMHPFSPPLDGYYWVYGRRVILSLVISLEEGKGHVTGLLARWMQEYDEIVVPTPFARMAAICEKRGFRWEWVLFEEDTPEPERVECLVWRRTQGGSV